MKGQLPLDVRLPAQPTLENFLPGDNESLLDALHRLLDGRLEQLYLAGPAGSGKSHLLTGAVRRATERGKPALCLALEALLAAGPDVLDGLAGHRLLALDGLERIAGRPAWERALFHLYNEARSRGTALLFAARHPPAGLGLELPDLRSRLEWGERYRLRPLDDAGKASLLLQRARQRGMEMSPEAAAWMVRHLGRDLPGLLERLDRLDRASLASRRRLTLPFVRQQLTDRP